MRQPPCRDRQRQLLSFVDEQRTVTPEQLMRAVADTRCPVGHELPYASLTTGLLSTGEDGRLRLGEEGDDWLLAHGAPSQDWRAAAEAGSPPLRDWQCEALQAWADHGRQGVVEAVTGTGKSRVGVEATREALRHDHSVVIVVPTTDLVAQWTRLLRSNSVQGVGANADGRKAGFDTHAVIVGTVQSLYAEPPTRPDGKVLVIADECHRYGAGMWKRVLHPTYRRRLGLTATFERNDDGIHDLLTYFGGNPVYKIGFDQAINSGVVAHYDVELFGIHLTGSERREYDATEQMLEDCRGRLLMADLTSEPFGVFLQQVQQAAEDDHDPAIADIARRYLKAFSDRIDILSRARAKVHAMRQLATTVQQSTGTIVFTRRVEAAEDLANALSDEGVSAQPIHSDLGRTLRQERLTDLRIGRVKALVAPTILDEGIDVPDIDLAIVMGGSKSRRQMIQRMGRVLRLKPDGRKATFIVVYAIDTVEDLTTRDGTEGCLDLITASADNVTDHATGKPIQPRHRPAPDVATSPGPRPPVADEPAVVPSTTAHSDRQPSPVQSLDPGSAHPESVDPKVAAVTRRALRSYLDHHGGTEAEARRGIRERIAEALRQGQSLVSGTGHRLLRTHTCTILLSADGSRIVDYRPRLRPTPPNPSTTSASDPDGPHLDDGSAAAVAPPSLAGPVPHAQSPRNEPRHTLDHRIDAARIPLTSAVMRQARNILGMPDHDLAEVEAEVRQLLQQDLADPAVSVTEVFGRLVVQSPHRKWSLSENAQSVTSLKGDVVQPTAVAEPTQATPPQGPPRGTAAAQDTGPNQGRQSAPEGGLVDQIERLARLLEQGLLTEEEYAAAKRLILFG